VFIVKILFSFVHFVLLQIGFIEKTSTDTSVSVKYSAVSDVFNRQPLHRYIARLNSLYNNVFCLMYAAIDTNLTKQYFLIKFLRFVCKMAPKILYLTLQ